MPQQPDPKSSSSSAAPATESGAPAVPTPHLADGQEHAHRRIPHWLERIELFLRVMIRMYIGLAVCYAPWSHMLWDQNPLFVRFPTLAIYASNGAVRGLVSGLGLLNLWVVLRDVMGRRER